MFLWTALAEQHQRRQLTLFDGTIIGRYIIPIVCAFWLLSGQLVSAQPCLIDAPRYNLTGDTVSWSMKIPSGHSCVRGVRFSRFVEIESIKLASPPQSGKLALQGPGFTYTAQKDFNGRDSFSLTVLGAINGTRGNSIIEVAVSVGEQDVIPPSISFTAPSTGVIVSGSSVTLSAAASDNVAVANVQFIIDGEKIGSAIISSPYTTMWDSTGVTNGLHPIYAVAQDTSGNYGTASIKVTVENTPSRSSTGR